MTSLKKQQNFFIGQTAIGLIAVALIIWGRIPDDYRLGLLYGIAASFLATGILGIFSSHRLLHNPQKAKQIEIAKNEERTVFIRTKARATSFIIMLYIMSGGTLLAGFLNYRLLSVTLAGLLMIQGVIDLIALGHYGRKY
jgi:uncharacterized membrane protein HdeD (DUF308 family)